jgi:hypothetical protein
MVRAHSSWVSGLSAAGFKKDHVAPSSWHACMSFASSWLFNAKRDADGWSVGGGFFVDDCLRCWLVAKAAS